MANETIEEYKKRINSKKVLLSPKPYINISDIKVIAPNLRETFNSQYIITSKMIESSGAISLIDLLKQQTGLNLTGIGEFGQSSLIKLNGSPANHIIILIDGIKINDPSSSQSFFDIGQIPLSFIEEIEIIKGPSSVMYGSGGIAGIINIKMKKYAENITYIRQEFGSYQTIINQAGSNINIGKLNLSIFGNFYESNGFSIAKFDDSKKGLEDDSSDLKDINLKFHYDFSSKTSLDGFFKVSSSKVDFDNFEFQPIDSEGTFIKKDEKFYYLKYYFKLFTTFENEVKISQYDTNKYYYEASNNITKKTNFIAKEQIFNYKSSYEFGNFIFIGGFDFESRNSKEYFYTNVTNDLSFYINSKEYISSNLMLEQGFRYSQNQRNIPSSKARFYNNTAYNLGLSYDIKDIDTYIKLSYGKSYRNPSLFELFSMSFGDYNLSSENSNGLNLEVLNTNFSSLIEQISVDFFYTSVDNMIYFYNSSYQNLASYLNYGFDITFPFSLDNFLLINNLQIIPSYTYLYALDKTTQQQTSLLPNHKLSIAFNLDINKRLNVFWQTLWKSSVIDTSSFNQKELGAYVLNNAMISIKTKENTKLFFRVENIFNKNYETSYGYNSKDRSYYIGLLFEM